MSEEADILVNGKTKLKCPECESESVIDWHHLEGYWDSFVDILTLGQHGKAKKCQECGCIWRKR